MLVRCPVPDNDEWAHGTKHPYRCAICYGYPENLELAAVVLCEDNYYAKEFLATLPTDVVAEARALLTHAEDTMPCPLLGADHQDPCPLCRERTPDEKIINTGMVLRTWLYGCALTNLAPGLGLTHDQVRTIHSVFRAMSPKDRVDLLALTRVRWGNGVLPNDLPPDP